MQWLFRTKECVISNTFLKWAKHMKAWKVVKFSYLWYFKLQFWGVKIAENSYIRGIPKVWFFGSFYLALCIYYKKFLNGLRTTFFSKPGFYPVNAMIK